MKKDSIIIAPITATNAAGKSSIALELGKQLGMKSVSAREVLTGLFYTDYQREPLSQTELGEFANEIRKDQGPEWLVKKVYSDILWKNIPGVYILESIRCPGELMYLQELREKYPHAVFKPIAIDAPKKVRYRRMVARPQDFKTPQSYRQFLMYEAEEYDQPEPWQMNIKKCIELVPPEGHFENLNGHFYETVGKIRDYLMR
ncbi:MAG TPA: AAA family ATPase [Candidatus Paceibacterota bacterium]|jgi:hypothetical protein|nr:AAA family ATPase [Candidatus Paceibacterota bacterium]